MKKIEIINLLRGGAAPTVTSHYANEHWKHLLPVEVYDGYNAIAVKEYEQENDMSQLQDSEAHSR